MKIFIIVMISYYEFKLLVPMDHSYKFSTMCIGKLRMEYLLIKGFSMEY